MADALDLVINMRNEKLKREQLRNQSIESGFQGIVDAAQNRRKLDILEGELKVKQDNSPLEQLGRRADAVGDLTELFDAGIITEEEAKARLDSLRGGQGATQGGADALVDQAGGPPQVSDIVSPPQTAKAAGVTQSLQTAQATGSTQPSPSGISAPELDIFGREKQESVDRRALELKQAEAKITTGKEVGAQADKASQRVEKELFNLKGAIENTVDSAFDHWFEELNLRGLKPGPVSGSVANLFNTFIKDNRFMDGLKGGLIEVAASTARIAMPGTRAIRAIDIFRRTTLSEFNTVESGVQNSVDSMRNGLQKDMKESPWEWSNKYVDEQGEYRPEFASEEARKRDYNSLSRKHKLDMSNEQRILLQDMERQVYDGFIDQAYMKGLENKGAHILQDKTVDEIEASFPKFNSEAEGDASVPAGEPYFVGDTVILSSGGN